MIFKFLILGQTDFLTIETASNTNLLFAVPIKLNMNQSAKEYRTLSGYRKRNVESIFVKRSNLLQ